MAEVIGAKGSCNRCGGSLTLVSLDPVERRGVLRCYSCDTQFGIIIQGRKRNPRYPQDEPCAREGCGHPYHRHFDGEEGDTEVGCKSCPCLGHVAPVPTVSDEVFAALIDWRLRGMDQDGEEAMSKVLYGFKHDFGPGQVLQNSVPEELRPAIAAYQALDEDARYELVGRHVLGEEGFRIHEEEIERAMEDYPY